MVFWYSICQLYKKRKITILTIVMSAMGFAVIYYAMINYAFYQYPKKQAAKLVSYDIQNVYMLAYQVLYVPIGNEELQHILSFDHSLDNVEDVMSHGMFFLENSYDGGENKFYMQKSISSLCNLYNTDGIMIDYDVNKSEYGFAVAGYNYAMEYPVGSVYEDDYGIKYVITDHLKKNSHYIPDDNIGNAGINLDDVIILDYDYALSQNITLLYNGLTSYYIVTDNKLAVDELIDEANGKGLHIYGINNIEDKYNRDIKDYMWANGESYYFPLILYIASMISLLMSSMISVYVNKKDMGIMLVNGISKRQLIAMISLQNAIRIAAFVVIAVFIWIYFGSRLTGAMKELTTKLIPWASIVPIVSYLLINVLSINMIRDKKAYELLN